MARPDLMAVREVSDCPAAYARAERAEAGAMGVAEAFAAAIGPARARTWEEVAADQAAAWTAAAWTAAAWAAGCWVVGCWLLDCWVAGWWVATSSEVAAVAAGALLIEELSEVGRQRVARALLPRATTWQLGSEVVMETAAVLERFAGMRAEAPVELAVEFPLRSRMAARNVATEEGAKEGYLACEVAVPPAVDLLLHLILLPRRRH